MDGNDIPKKAVDPAASAGTDSVDDILRDIMKPDGTFNEEFSELFSRYLGGSVSDLPLSDLSDRTGEARPRMRVEYEQPAPVREAAPAQPAAQRLNEKLPPNVREVYERETRSAVRPEFTNEGTVRYPSMGVGASEERVVFDADWEERAKKEAARREKIRRENMLKGDSTYVRSFRFSSAEDAYYRQPNVNSAYIDPLDDSGDVSIFTDRRPERRPRQDVSDERDGNSFFKKVFPKSEK